MANKILFVLSSVVLTISSCDDNGSVSNVSVSGCLTDLAETRANSLIGAPRLKMTRHGDEVDCALYNWRLNCATQGAEVSHTATGNLHHICISDRFTDDIRAMCSCPRNVTFTIGEVFSDEISVTLNDLDLGRVSFAGHDVVQIDLRTMAQAHEEGFDYPLSVSELRCVELTDYAGKLWWGDLVPRLEIHKYTHWMECTYKGFALPEAYDTLMVRATLQDGVLDVVLLSDAAIHGGTPRMADLYFGISNVLEDVKSLHMSLARIDASDGRVFEARCVYDGPLEWTDKWSNCDAADVALPEDLTSSLEVGYDFHEIEVK